jgi:gliding motility-associated-like protein
MKKCIAFSILLTGFCLTASADHITGGEMFYSFRGKNGAENLYQVTLKLFMRCNSGRRFNDPTTVSVFDRLTNVRITDLSVPLTRQENIRLNNSNPCITNPPDVCYDVAYYEFTISLPPNDNGYLLASQVNFRIAGINNLSQGYGQVGATYTAEIPGTLHNEAAAQNNSAHFTGSDLVIVCASNSFSYSFAAKDDDGDQLRYSFCEAYISGTSGTNVPPPLPPYPSVPYGQGFAATMPLGEHVTLSTATGLITGIAPSSGVYVVTVCVEELRNGLVIATQRKDLQINITECSIAAATLLPEYQLCTNTKTLHLANLSNSPLIDSYSWQIFNSSGTRIYSSTSPTTSYEFADTGLYKLSLHINEGQQCSDSASSLIRVYPGLQAAFSYSGICAGKPTSFSDASQTVYGTIHEWSWDFGDLAGDTSHARDPAHTYVQTGVKNVSLVVGTTRGCRDTIIKALSILDKPPLSLSFRDTLICKGDTLRLQALGDGNFSWTPSLFAINAASAAPLVQPPVTTTYVVELDDNGCKNKDSLAVRVVDFVSLAARSDTVICENDEVQLGGVTNGLQFNWSPAGTVNNAGLLNALAKPASTTTYRLTASIGHCSAADDVIIKVVPYPTVAAGADTLICHNTSCQLKGFTDGSSVQWSPGNAVDNAGILNPVASPPATTEYILSAYDTKGCPKPARDTVLVTVLPKIFPEAGNDTAVVTGQPLQLNAGGGSGYVWSPAFNLSSDTIANPVAVFNDASEERTYKVLVYNKAGCVDSDYVHIKVYTTQPTVFVPTAFTPNNDGKNDLLRPIAAGITRIEYFRIYNRWGQLVFSTTQSGRGWDGRILGREQGTGTFVWEVKATDYKGLPFIQKGNVTLIR